MESAIQKIKQGNMTLTEWKEGTILMCGQRKPV